MPRGTPKQLTGAQAAEIENMAGTGASPYTVGKQFGISATRITGMWKKALATADEAGPVVKHEADDSRVRNTKNFSAKTGGIAKGKLAESSSESGSSEGHSGYYSEEEVELAPPPPTPRKAKRVAKTFVSEETPARLNVLTAAVEAQGGPRTADPLTLESAVLLATRLAEAGSISRSKYTRVISSLLEDDTPKHAPSKRTKQHSRRRDDDQEPPQREVRRDDAAGPAQPSGGGLLGGPGEDAGDGRAQRGGRRRW